MPYAHVALLSPPYATLTYSLPEYFGEELWRPGLRVAVPLGRGGEAALRAAVLLDVRADADVPPGVVCKAVFWPLETTPLLSPALLELMRDLALRQGVEPGHVLGHVLPQGLRSTGVRLRRLGGRAETWSLRGLRQAGADERAELARELASGAARLLPGAWTPPARNTVTCAWTRPGRCGLRPRGRWRCWSFSTRRVRSAAGGCSARSAMPLRHLPPSCGRAMWRSSMTTARRTNRERRFWRLLRRACASTRIRRRRSTTSRPPWMRTARKTACSTA